MLCASCASSLKMTPNCRDFRRFSKPITLKIYNHIQNSSSAKCVILIKSKIQQDLPYEYIRLGDIHKQTQTCSTIHMLHAMQIHTR